ncbi:MAG: GreA/GreB family elongation factor [Planctomycetes bacterium]|nr:GreA/GreB family elongation factor [Planctomycetota bacterium]
MSGLVMRLNSALAEARWNDYDELWLDAIEGKQGALHEYLEATRAAMAAGQGERAGQWLSMMALEATALPLPQRREYFELLVTCLPKERDLREQLIAVYEAEFKEVPGYTAYMRAADLKRNPDPAAAITQLRKMLRFVAGAYVYHRSGWGVGVIREVIALESAALIDFQKKPAHRMKLEAIPEICELLSDDDFRVVSWKEPARLRMLAEEDPVELFKMVVRSSDRPLPLGKIREAIAGHAIPGPDWTKWWGKVRAALKRDPSIGVSGGKMASYFMQKTQRGVGSELSRRLNGAQVKDRLSVLREAVAGATAAERAEIEPHLARLQKDLERRDAEVPLLAEILLFLRRQGALATDAGLPAANLPTMDDFLAHYDHPIDLLNLLARGEDQAEVLQTVRALQGAAWPEVITDFLLRADDGVRELLVAEMVAAGRTAEIDYHAREIHRVPKKAPLYFLWLLRLAARRDWKLIPSLRSIPANDLFQRAISILDDLSLRAEGDSSPALEVSVRRYRAQLGARPFTLLQQVCEGADLNAVRAIYHQLEASRGMTDNTLERMLATLLRLRPTLLAGEVIATAHVADSDSIYATDEGIRKIRKELELIRNDKLPTIYRAIGDAASMGDLSENAEFTSAIEERENLNRRVLELQSQLDRAVRIDLAAAHTDRASIGTRVSLRNVTTGNVETYSILGPWDSSAEQGIVSYQAPLGRAILDRKPGEEFAVELPTGAVRYRLEEIARIANAKQ